MSSPRPSTKRKAEEAVPETEQEDTKKRLKKGDEPDQEGVKEGAVAGGSEEEDDVDEEELEALDSTNVIEGGRRTRGVRVDYTKMKFDEEDDEEDEEEEDEGKGVEGDEEEGKGGEEGEEEHTDGIDVSKGKNGYAEDE